MWNWYEWNSLEDFNDWHGSIKKQLGYPLASYNQATGELVDPEAVKEYTSATEVSGKFIAQVEIQLAGGLVETELRIPEKEIS